MTGRSGHGTHVLCRAGRSGPDGAASRVHGGVFPVSARCGLGPLGVPATPHDGAAEGTENLVHKGCVCCLGFLLSTDGGLQLPAHRQRPDLVDRENGAQVCRSGGLRCPLALADGLQLLSTVQLEPPRRRPVPAVWPAALSPRPEAVEGMPRVPAAGFPRHDSRQGVGGLVMGQGGGAVRQGCSCLEHGDDSFQVPVALLWVRGDLPLVVVATFQHDGGDGTGFILASWGCCVCRLRPWWVSLHQVPKVAPPDRGCPAFTFRQAFVRWDVEGVGSRLWGSLFPAPDAWRGPLVHRWRNERVCPAQVRDPYPALVRLVDVEPTDPRVNKVVRNLHPGGDERLELPHGDVSACGVRQRDHSEEPLSVDVLEMSPEGCQQHARGCVGVDVVDCPQVCFVKEVRVPQLSWSRGWGGMVSWSRSGVVPVREGCPGMVSRCSSGTFPVEGSCCGDIGRDAAVGGDPLDF